MKRLAALLLACAAVPSAAQPTPEHVHQRAEWNRPFEPFRIAGSVYFVGTEGLSAYLITDPKGHILIDGGLEESAAQIAANIRTLGFRLRDVRILLINHAHYDHSGGLADLKRLTGARLLASAGDRPELESGRSAYRDDLAPASPVKVDRVIGEGDAIGVGKMRLVTHLTPGHTKGCTSWTLRTEEAGRPLDILFACSISVADQPLVNDARYPEAERDFRATFAKLRGLKADIYLSFHPFAFDMAAKRAKQQAGDPLAFVNPDELASRVATAEKAFGEELARQKAGTVSGTR